MLAQTYHNSTTEDGKQKKARISRHSDKTKDMPSNSVMAFCTFYDFKSLFDSVDKKYHPIQTKDGDWVYKNTRSLTFGIFFLKKKN